MSKHFYRAALLFLVMLTAPDARHEALATGLGGITQASTARDTGTLAKVKLECKVKKNGSISCGNSGNGSKQTSEHKSDTGNKGKGACGPGQNRDPKTGVCFSCSHNDHFENGRCVPCRAGFHVKGDACVAD